jgi:hypothetical protein
MRRVDAVRRASDTEQRHYGVQWRSASTWREQPSVETMAGAVRKRIGRKRNLYIAEYAKAMGISPVEAKRRIKAQRAVYRPAVGTDGTDEAERGLVD